MLGAKRDRHQRRAVEAAGDVDVLLLDKTGTITLGNRQASAFLPAQGVEEKTLADAAQLSSLATKRRKAAASWCWQNSALICASAICNRCMPPSCRLPPRPG
ncbi:potassium-transporting ATPase subunit B [Klebsiella michiganensis]|nr:potassium-transporting ATPase subunit B [Klebsiella michiganensis]